MKGSDTNVSLDGTERTCHAPPAIIPRQLGSDKHRCTKMDSTYSEPSFILLTGSRCASLVEPASRTYLNTLPQVLKIFRCDMSFRTVAIRRIGQAGTHQANLHHKEHISIFE